MVKCTLDKDINKCPYLVEDGCSNPNHCSFQQEDKEALIEKERYVREERWYEKYYRKK